jgi:hypothetical protein
MRPASVAAAGKRLPHSSPDPKSDISFFQAAAGRMSEQTLDEQFPD